LLFFIWNTSPQPLPQEGGANEIYIILLRFLSSKKDTEIKMNSSPSPLGEGLRARSIERVEKSKYDLNVKTAESGYVLHEM
jgi:hypothetical protein